MKQSKVRLRLLALTIGIAGVVGTSGFVGGATASAAPEDTCPTPYFINIVDGYPVYVAPESWACEDGTIHTVDTGGKAGQPVGEGPYDPNYTRPGWVPYDWNWRDLPNAPCMMFLDIAPDGVTVMMPNPALWTADNACTEPEFSADNSLFRVKPTADGNDRSTWVAADGVASYTLTLIALDTDGNAMADLNLADIKFTVGNPRVTVSDVVNNGDGSYTAKCTATDIVIGASVSLTVLDTPVGNPVKLYFA